jgi:hypothetical protein
MPVSKALRRTLEEVVKDYGRNLTAKQRRAIGAQIRGQLDTMDLSGGIGAQIRSQLDTMDLSGGIGAQIRGQLDTMDLSGGIGAQIRGQLDTMDLSGGLLEDLVVGSPAKKTGRLLVGDHPAAGAKAINDRWLGRTRPHEAGDHSPQRYCPGDLAKLVHRDISAIYLPQVPS